MAENERQFGALRNVIFSILRLQAQISWATSDEWKEECTTWQNVDIPVSDHEHKSTTRLETTSEKKTKENVHLVHNKSILCKWKQSLMFISQLVVQNFHLDHSCDSLKRIYSIINNCLLIGHETRRDSPWEFIDCCSRRTADGKNDFWPSRDNSQFLGEYLTCTVGPY